MPWQAAREQGPAPFAFCAGLRQVVSIPGVRANTPLDSNLLPEDHPYVHRATCIACDLINRTMAERVGPLFVPVRDRGLAAHVLAVTVPRAYRQLLP
jgi:hypothetical protein